MLRFFAPILVVLPVLTACSDLRTRAPECVSVPYENGVEHRVCNEGGRLFIRSVGDAPRAESQRLLSQSIQRAIPILHPSGNGYLGPNREGLPDEGAPVIAAPAPVRTVRGAAGPDLSTLRVEDGIPVRIERPVPVRVREAEPARPAHRRKPKKILRSPPVTFPAPQSIAPEAAALGGSYPLLSYGSAPATGSLQSTRPNYLAQAPKSAGAPICDPPSSKAGNGMIDVRLPGGAEVRFSGGIDPALMAAALAALARKGM